MQVDETPTDRVQELFASLDRRYRPEDIAELIEGRIGHAMNAEEIGVLKKASRHALRVSMGFSSMSQDFARPIGMERQLKVSAYLFPTVKVPQTHDDPLSVKNYLLEIEPSIGKQLGRSDFKKDRLNEEQRRERGMDISKRQYNKRFRLAARMEAKVARLEREWQKRGFTLVSKSRLASRLTWDEFSSDLDSACFIAYYTSRCNLRSEFTINGQQRPYDEIADMLFARCAKSPTVNWWAIAHVFPERQVLRYLNDEQKGRLLGKWFARLIGWRSMEMRMRWSWR